LNDQLRLELVEQAIENDKRLLTSDIEFHLPRPSYTIDTLTYLEERFPRHEFVLIMGSDGLRTFHKWKNSEVIIEKYRRYVYPRNTESKEEILQHKNIKLVEAPQLEISSSFIRKAIADGKDMRHFLPPPVFRAIEKYGYYLP
jgi:nicotinate-nucleotide adenylyltransferase